MNPLSAHTLEPLDRARLALEGLSLGDAFGERFFGPPEEIDPLISERRLPDAHLWKWTDDTAMALAIFEVLRDHQHIDPDALAERFFERYTEEPWRGYGGGAHRLFATRQGGTGWREAATSLFDGSGSFGNGAAMRAAPIGAYFFEDLDRVVAQATASALPTHAHIDGIAGGIAIALAAALGIRDQDLDIEVARENLFDTLLARVPESETRDGIVKATHVPLDASIRHAADRLGNGTEISSRDTVPLCVWMIARDLRDYEAGLWETVEARGDRDTTCAIVGGVLALSAPQATFPAAWLARRESLGEL